MYILAVVNTARVDMLEEKTFEISVGLIETSAFLKNLKLEIKK